MRSLQERWERLIGGARDEHAEHVGARVIGPLLAGLMQQRQRTELLHPLVRRHRRRIGSGQQTGVADGFLNRILAGRREYESHAEAERQQIARGDRPLRRHRLVDRRVDPRQHAAVGEFRQEAIDGIVEAQFAFFDQYHRRNRGDRFRHRRDAEQRVALHRLRSADGVMSDGVDVNFAATAHQRDESR